MVVIGKVSVYMFLLKGLLEHNFATLSSTSGRDAIWSVIITMLFRRRYSYLYELITLERGNRQIALVPVLENSLLLPDVSETYFSPLCAMMFLLYFIASR